MSDSKIGLSVGLSEKGSQYFKGYRRNQRAVATAIVSAIALVDCTSSVLGATTTSTWVGTLNSSWNDAGNWIPNAEYPSNGNNSISDFSVVINAGVTPNLNVNVTIDALTLGALATLNINGNNSLTLNSTLTNNGQIIVNNNQAYGSTLTASGSISGTGDIILDSNGSNAVLA